MHRHPGRPRIESRRAGPRTECFLANDRGREARHKLERTCEELDFLLVSRAETSEEHRHQHHHTPARGFNGVFVTKSSPCNCGLDPDRRIIALSRRNTANLSGQICEVNGDCTKDELCLVLLSDDRFGEQYHDGSHLIAAHSTGLLGATHSLFRVL